MDTPVTSGARRPSGLILVAASSPSVRFRAQAVLGKRAHVIATSDGLRACQLFVDHSPDVVLLAADIDRLDGYATCVRLRRAPHGKSVPILLMAPWGDDVAIARAYTAGATDVQPTPVDWRMTSERILYLLETKRMTDMLHRLAYYDDLTSLPNRAFFRERLREAIYAAHETGRAVAVVFVDLDRFKPINDRFGHWIGDALLRDISERLHRKLQPSDPSTNLPTCLVGRFGGDEFTVLVRDLPDAAMATHVVRRVNALFAAPFSVGGHTFHMSASLGISVYPLHGHEPDALLAHADAAMYRQKRRGSTARSS